jgi:hypothetical protein
VSTRPVTPTTEAERVLGQIQRGELRCGADAAREIAARHEAAYGGAFTRPASNDDAWADALTALTTEADA